MAVVPSTAPLLDNESKEMSMSIEGAGLAVLIKTKLLAFAPALVGALLMAVFRPPKTKKEMFWQGAVALGGSFLFGGVATGIVGSWMPQGVDPTVAVHGLIGALSWGAFGGLAHWRDERLAKDPIAAIKEVKDVI